MTAFNIARKIKLFFNQKNTAQYDLIESFDINTDRVPTYNELSMMTFFTPVKMLTKSAFDAINLDEVTSKFMTEIERKLKVDFHDESETTSEGSDSICTIITVGLLQIYAEIKVNFWIYGTRRINQDDGTIDVKVNIDCEFEKLGANMQDGEEVAVPEVKLTHLLQSALKTRYEY